MLGVWVSDGVSRCGGAGCRPWAQAAAGRPVTPVTCSQIAKRMVISARCWVPVIRWRWGRKWGEMLLNAARNRCAVPTLQMMCPGLHGVELLDSRRSRGLPSV